MQAVAEGANDFAFRLGAELIADAGNENLVVSPFAVWLPVAALVNAVEDNSKPTLLHALGATGISETDINNAASRMMYGLVKSRRVGSGIIKSPSKIVHAIFIDNRETLKRDFAQTYKDYFRGGTINVDFSSQHAIDAVNRWASEKTDGLISGLVQGFKPATVAAIAGAIFFSGDWEMQFDPGQTEEGIFHSPDGDTSAMFMLHKDTIHTYYEDDKIQALPLGFTSGGGMYIVLPKSGSAADTFFSMTNDYFKEIRENSMQATGTLKLPRFSIENEVDGLKEALATMGIPLFEGNAPVLTGLVEGHTALSLSDAIQKATIRVDENGTTAAAVFYAGAAACEGPYIDPAEPFEMICDRPFVFILYDLTHDGGYQVLFTGVVNQP